MEVYLVNRKPFQATFRLPHGYENYQKIEATWNLDVDLQPEAGSEESQNFSDAIKSSLAMSGLDMDFICRRGILASMKFMSAHRMHIPQNTYPPCWDPVHGLGPVTLTLQVTGPYLTELMKVFNEPLLMKVAIYFQDHDISTTSREYLIGIRTEGTGSNFNLENQGKLTLESISAVFLYPRIYPGTMTLSLVRFPFVSIVSQLLGPFPNAFVINRKLLEDKIECDFAIVASNGVVVQCHKSFLASHSQVFERMLRSDCNETKENKYQLRISEEAVNSLLKFLYYSNLDEPIRRSSIAFELLQVAHEYGIESLENAMKQMFLFADSWIQWFDPDVMLRLFQFSVRVYGYEALKEKAVQVLKLKRFELRDSVFCEQLFNEDPECAKELLLQSL